MRPPFRVGSFRRSLKGSLIGVVAVAVLAGAMDLGVHIPGLGFLSPFAGAATLDYATGATGGFAPLDARYVREQLGVSFPATEPLSSRGSLRGRAGAPGDVLGRPVDVRHAFTNDAFAQAYPIAGTPFTARTDTKGASRESGESSQCGKAGTVWYRYTPSRSATMQADTFGTNYGTALGAFRRSASGVQLMACNASAFGNAQISIPVTAGTTYFFRIARAAGRTGTRLVFHLFPLGTTERLSVGSDGSQANGLSSLAFPSADGRYVVFDSDAANMVSNQNACISAVSVPPTACDDVYIRDLARGTTRIASVSSSGAYGNDTSFFPTVSGDGRYVAFSSYSSNLVPGDTNAVPDIFVHDMVTGKTIRASVATNGAQGYVDRIPGIVDDPITLRELFPAAMISENGRFVAFDSRAGGLAPGDRDRCTPGSFVPALRVHCRDVYVKDLSTGRTELITDPGHGDRSDNDSFVSSISADGRFVAFLSIATNLVPGGAVNNAGQMYVRDRLRKRTLVASVSSSGQWGSGDTVFHSPTSQISADGRLIAFESRAPNLVPGDSNDTDIFVHDFQTGRTVMASVSSEGVPKNGQDTGERYSLSDDGRYVTFDSVATNLVPGDTNGKSDAFVHDLLTGSTTLVSVTTAGVQGDGDTREACGAARAGLIVFSSNATNLVPGDTNRNQDIFSHLLVV